MTDPASGITMEELALAARNHGMPLEALRYDVTPVGLHYLLIHFDIPEADETTWRLEVGGRVRAAAVADHGGAAAAAGGDRAGDPGVRRQRPGPARPAAGQPALAGGGGGHGRVDGHAAGAPARGGRGRPGAVEVLFGGADRGVQGGLEHDYERSLPLAEAMRAEVLLAWGVNGQPLPPQHGYPLRLVVPGWYGMTSVKWLRRITLLTEPFDGYQQTGTYLLHTSEDDPGTPVTRIQPRSLLLPPGRPRVRVPPPVPPSRPPPAVRPGLVGPGPGGPGRGQHRRRRQLGAGPAGAASRPPGPGPGGASNGTRPPAATSSARGPPTPPATPSPPRSPGTPAATPTTPSTGCRVTVRPAGT